MFQTAGYPVHPPYFSPYNSHRSPPQTPPTPSGHAYNSPRQFVYIATPPSKGHARRSTRDTPAFAMHAYTPPRRSARYMGPEYSSPAYYASAHATPQRKSDYIPVYTSADSSKVPPRRASYGSQPPRPTKPMNHCRPSTAAKPPRQATEEDTRRAGIPTGYSCKNWDPSEEPILLLGSVFDANSLGKWIYDWAVFFYGAPTPMSEMAGELWILLIQLAGNIKRAEGRISHIRQKASRDLVDGFLESGERLWQRFSKLLKICENYMWKAAKKHSRDSTKITMGQNSGCEFVDSIFGRDRELKHTENLMTAMRFWLIRFDANCEEILQNPSA